MKTKDIKIDWDNLKLWRSSEWRLNMIKKLSYDQYWPSWLFSTLKYIGLGLTIIGIIMIYNALKTASTDMVSCNLSIAFLIGGIVLTIIFSRKNKKNDEQIKRMENIRKEIDRVCLEKRIPNESIQFPPFDLENPNLEFCGIRRLVAFEAEVKKTFLLQRIIITSSIVVSACIILIGTWSLIFQTLTIPSNLAWIFLIIGWPLLHKLYPIQKAMYEKCNHYKQRRRRILALIENEICKRNELRTKDLFDAIEKRLASETDTDDESEQWNNYYYRSPSFWRAFVLFKGLLLQHINNPLNISFK